MKPVRDTNSEPGLPVLLRLASLATRNGEFKLKQEDLSKIPNFYV